MRALCPAHLIFLGEEQVKYKQRSYSLQSFLHSVLNESLLGSNNALSTSFASPVDLLFYISFERETKYLITWAYIILCYFIIC
jgi:hypothetical protein